MRSRYKILIVVLIMLPVILGGLLLQRSNKKSALNIPNFLLMNQDFKVSSSKVGDKDVDFAYFSIQKPASQLYASYLDLLSKERWSIQEKSKVNAAEYLIRAYSQSYLHTLFNISIQQSDDGSSIIGIVIDQL